MTRNLRKDKTLGTSVIILIACGAGAFAGFVTGLAKQLPTPEEAAYISRSPEITIDAKYLATGNENDFMARVISHIALPIQANEIPLQLKDAIIAHEDRRFLIHHGVDWIGLLRAMATDLTGHRVEGAS